MAKSYRKKSGPRFSLATLLGVMGYISFCMPLVVILGPALIYHPVSTLSALVVIAPFLLPGVVASLVLCEAMIENVSRRRD